MENFPFTKQGKNCTHVMQIIDELGSFNKYIWDFVNKPVVSNFHYPRQVPIKTSKAEMISKDLVRRGFRGVGPTIVYSFNSCKLLELQMTISSVASYSMTV